MIFMSDGSTFIYDVLYNQFLNSNDNPCQAKVMPNASIDLKGNLVVSISEDGRGMLQEIVYNDGAKYFAMDNQGS